MKGFSGSCHCGAIQYSSSSDPVNIQNCHCNDCKKSSGAVYQTNIFIPLSSFKISGELGKFVHISDRGSQMTKYFCSKCGSHIYGENSFREGAITIRAGSINEKKIIKPLRDIFLSSKIESTPLNVNLDKFEKMPS